MAGDETRWGVVAAEIAHRCLLTDDQESVKRLAAALHFDWCPDKEIRPDHQPGSVDMGQAKRLIEWLRRA